MSEARRPPSLDPAHGHNVAYGLHGRIPALLMLTFYGTVKRANNGHSALGRVGIIAFEPHNNRLD